MVDNIEINALPISTESGDALIKPVAKSIGNAANDILEGAFHLVLDPVRRFNARRTQDLETFKQELSLSVKDISKDNIDESKSGLVLKAIEDSRYQLNEKVIRDLFTKLITSTLDITKNTNITPVFSTIIANMSPKEAILLERIHNNTGHVVPFSNVMIVYKDVKGSSSIGKGYLLFENDFTNEFSLELSLLEASNLIKFNADVFLTHTSFEDLYNLFDENYIVDLNINSDSNIQYEQHKHYYSLTELGKSFCQIIFDES